MKPMSKMLLVVATALLCAVSSYAQNANGSLGGKVVDLEGKPMANVVVRIVNIADTDRTEVKTSRNGEFFQSGLFPGKHRLTVIQDGKTLMIKGDDIGDEV